MDRNFLLKKQYEKLKVNKRNYSIRILADSQWSGYTPNMVRIIRLKLCFSIGEDTCVDWNQLKHVRYVDAAFDETYGLITECFKNIAVKLRLPNSEDLAPPGIWRHIVICIKRAKQTT